MDNFKAYQETQLPKSTLLSVKEVKWECRCMQRREGIDNINGERRGKVEGLTATATTEGRVKRTVERMK